MCVSLSVCVSGHLNRFEQMNLVSILTGASVKWNQIKSKILRSLTGGDGGTLIVCIRYLQAQVGWNQQSSSKRKQGSNDVLSVYISAL